MFWTKQGVQSSRTGHVVVVVVVFPSSQVLCVISQVYGVFCVCVNAVLYCTQSIPFIVRLGEEFRNAKNHYISQGKAKSHGMGTFDCPRAQPQKTPLPRHQPHKITSHCRRWLHRQEFIAGGGFCCVLSGFCFPAFCESSDCGKKSEDLRQESFFFLQRQRIKVNTHTHTHNR